MNKFLGILFILIVAGLGFLFYKMQQPSDIKNQDDALSLPYKAELQSTGNTQPANEQSSASNEATIDPTQTATKATIKTSKGDITFELYPDVAPKTVANFVTKAKSGFYENLTFHRVEDWVIQGGDPTGTGAGGGNIPSEFNNKPYIVGSVGVARRSDPKVQNDSQFFITKTEASWLNSQYTNFGTVTEGMDVVNKIEIGDKILSITTE